MSKSILIKNIDFSIPVIQILEFDINQIIAELRQFVPVNEEQHQVIPCVLSIMVSEVKPTFLAQLVEALRQVNLLAIGLKTDDDSLIEQANYAGLAVFSEKMTQLDLFQQKVEQANHRAELPQQQIHSGNVCAGQQIYAEGRDLIVLGDVESGAEVIADGNIYIGGSLSGKAYAGNSGQMNIDTLHIRAYSFEPELVSISGFYQLSEDIPIHYKGLAVKTQFINQKLAYHLE